MKKVLALSLVLVAASFANAGLILSGSGAAGSEMLAIQNVAPAATYQGFFALVGVDGEVAISGGAYGANKPDISDLNGSIADTPDVAGLFPGMNGIWGVIAMSSGSVGDALATGEFFKSIQLNYVPGPKASVIQLVALNEDGTVGQALGSYTVNVIPEPATMALLGLGGLFFARKK